MRILIFFLFSTQLYGFDAPVNYWEEETHSTIPQHWQSYLNPNSINFWKEGDYTPPMPQIWAMRDPSPQNIALYKTYLKRRAGMLETFQTALKQDQITQIEKIIVAFRSDCSACHQLLKELGNYPQIFNRVQLLQVDQGAISLPWPITHISEAQTKELQINMVPTVWVKKQSERFQRLENPTKLFEEFL